MRVLGATKWVATNAMARETGWLSLTQKHSYCLDFKLISTFAPIPPGDHLLILQVRKLRLGGIKGIVEPSLEPDSKPLHTGASEALGEGRMQVPAPSTQARLGEAGRRGGSSKGGNWAG